MVGYDETRTVTVLPVPQVERELAEAALQNVRRRLLGIEAAPRRLGRYLLVRTAGEGGMGLVCEAYDPVLRRRVAIKSVRMRSRADRDELDLRLLREAQALAKLAHPNVVRVFEVFEHEGQPLLVMEYVEGVTLETWTQRERPDVARICTVFASIAAGLAAVHQVGVVHRDFKPSNVLLDHEVPKLVDFGLAMVGPQAPTVDDGSPRRGDDSLTETGAVMGTPAYMAPEQHRGDIVDARADQFAFCVALYEALHGERPFRGRGAEELGMAKLQGVDRQRAARRLPARLAEAIERGLAPHPDDRWPDMDTLRAALAMPPRRRRIGWAAGALTVTLAAGVGLARQTAEEPCPEPVARRAGAYDGARAERIAAAFAATELPFAEPVGRRVHATLDDYAARWQAAHVDACRATAILHAQSEADLDLRMTCLHRALVALDAAASQLEHADATTVERAVPLVEGLPGLSVCSDLDALRETVQPPPENERRIVEELRERLAEANAAGSSGHFEEARRVLELIRRDAQGLTYPDVGLELDLLEGRIRRELGHWDAAQARLQSAYRRAMQLRRGPQMHRAAHELSQLIGVDRRDAETGLHYARVAEALAGHDPAAASAVTSRGPILVTEARYAEAEALYVPLIAAAEAALDPDDGRLMTARNHLSIVLSGLGKHAESEAQRRRVLETSERVLGPDHPNTLGDRSNIAISLYKQGRYADAEAMIRDVLDARLRALGSDHPDIAASYSLLGSTLARQRKHAEAEQVHRQALASRTAIYGPDHPLVADSLLNIANALEAQKQPEGSLDLLYRALAIYQDRLGPLHPSVANVHNNLAATLSQLESFDAAEDEYRLALAGFEASLGRRHPTFAFVLTHFADMQLKRGRPRMAFDLAREAWTLRQGQEDAPVSRADTAFALARATWAVDDTERGRAQARMLARSALELCELGTDSQAADEIRSWLSEH